MRKLETLAALAALLILTVGAIPAQAEPCEPGWAEGVFCPPALVGTVLSITTWDDGTGEAAYIGGAFPITGCETVLNGVARWDGSGWSPLAGANGIQGASGFVYVLLAHDDGSGSALYAGGELTAAGGEPLAGIARWNGSEWSALLSPGGTGLESYWVQVPPVSTSSVYALTSFDDGTGPALYVGGNFRTAGGVEANGIAKWDGSQWTALDGPSGTGVNYTILALEVFDDGSGPALYAGGWFTTAGGVEAVGIARWDGAEWTPVVNGDGEGLNDDVRTLTVHDDGSGPALYAGGWFTTAGGVEVNRIAKWDGADWTALAGPDGVGVNGTVRALGTYDDGGGPALYVGGEFLEAGGMPISRVARWTGSNWLSPGGSAANGNVRAFGVADNDSGPELLMGGEFSEVDGTAAFHIARWNGSAWSAMPEPTDSAGMSSTVYTLTNFDDGSGEAMYAGGVFINAGREPVNRIARWDGSEWSALAGPDGTGVNHWVRAMTVFDDGTGPALYMGGRFTTAGGIEANRIVRWDGSVWSALKGPGGVGVNNEVRALTVFNDGTGPALYAGGEFTTAGGVETNFIAKWDGTSWSALEGPGGNGVSGGSLLRIEALTVFDDGTGPALYAGGTFTTAGGVTVNRIARWDGSVWSALEGPGGVGVSGTVYALTDFDDGSGGGPALYAGGFFTTAGGVMVNNIARWDGSAWSGLEGSDGVGVTSTVEALTVFDDGSGPALYAGGGFSTAGGVTVNRIARWDGSDWSAMEGPSGVGMSSTVYALKGFGGGSGPALYAGGNFTTAGGLASHFIAKWTGCPPDPSCNAADLAEPFGMLDLADIVAFVTAFGAQDPAADLAEPFGVFDLADVVAFVVAFEAGCP